MPLLPEKRPANEQEINAFLAAFEAGMLPKEEFTHAAHLLTGACCVYQLGETAAISHMRGAIRHFNESVGGKNTDTSGYHETLTVFWIKVLAALKVEPLLSRAEFAAHAVQRYGGRRDLFKQFYDFDVVASVEARRDWIAPNVKPLTLANL